MDFEYGCITANKYSFLNENEVEDPSDLLAQVNIATKDIKESVLTSKAGSRTAKTSKLVLDTKSNGKQASANKDIKKQPLQQHTENSVKSGKVNYTDDNKKEGKQKQIGQQRQAVGSISNQAPREDKENSSNKQRDSGAGFDKKSFGQYQQARNERRTDRNENSERPPRRMGPRSDFSDKPERGPDRQERPRPYRRPQQQIAEGTIETQTNEEGNIVEGEENTNSGFKRGGIGGNFRGGRNGFGRTGNFRSQYRQRRINDPDQPREFDRHSGSEKTGVKPIDKKDGAGKGNWGTANDELEAAENLNDTQGELSEQNDNQNWASRVDEKDQENDENKEVVPHFMTLDEYKALKNEVNKKNEFNTRQPGEGEDPKKWGETYLLPKKPKDEEDDDDEQEEQDDEEVEEEGEEHDKKKDIIKQIQIKFYEPASTNRDRRGGRSGGRGGATSSGFERRKPERKDKLGETTEISESSAIQNTSNEQASPEKRRFNNRPIGAPGPRNNQRRGGPGQMRLNQSRTNVPKIEDEKDFPSLVKA